MTIHELLKERQAAIKERWINLIIGTYPANSRGFFLGQKNRFQNPVGDALVRQADEILEVLLKGTADEPLTPALEEFIKIRAVQDFKPSQAIGFIFYLKLAIREELAETFQSQSFFNELLTLESRLDLLLLQALDFYMQSREKIYEIRANELRRQSYLALRRAGGNLPDFGTNPDSP